MDVDIQILNVLDWSKTNDNKEVIKEGSTLVYIIVGKDYFTESDNFIGFGSITNFYDKKLRHLFNRDLIGKTLKGHLNITRSFKDPTRTFSKLASVSNGNQVIDLL